MSLDGRIPEPLEWVQFLQRRSDGRCRPLLGIWGGGASLDIRRLLSSTLLLLKSDIWPEGPGIRIESAGLFRRSSVRTQSSLLEPSGSNTGTKAGVQCLSAKTKRIGCALCWALRDKQPMGAHPKISGGSQQPMASTPANFTALIPHNSPAASDPGHGQPSTESALLDDDRYDGDKGRRRVATGWPFSGQRLAKAAARTAVGSDEQREDGKMEDTRNKTRHATRWPSPSCESHALLVKFGIFSLFFPGSFPAVPLFTCRSIEVLLSTTSLGSL